MPKLNWFYWITNPSLREAAESVLNGGRLLQEDARLVIEQLQEESAAHIKKRVGESFYSDYFPTDRVGPEWKEGQPYGVVDHYTAGIDNVKPIRWFSSRPREPGVGNSSAHYVIDRDGVILQLINPLHRVAWHARSFSYTHIGIEHVNAGLLRKVNGKLRYMNTIPYPEGRVEKVQEIEGENWEPYQVRQIVANIVLKRLLQMAIPALVRPGFIDHEMADPHRKRDCGPLWPMHDINALVFSGEPVRNMLWMDEECLSQVGVYEFHREVQEHLMRTQNS